MLPRAGISHDRSRHRIYQYLPGLAAEGFQFHILPPGLTRALRFWKKDDYDLALIEEAAFPELPAAARRLAARRLPPVRVVIGGAPDGPEKEPGGAVYADILETPGDAGEDRLVLHPAPDWLRLSPIERKRLRRRIGWIGGAENLAALYAILPHLTALQQTHQFTLVTIGARPTGLSIPNEHHETLPLDPSELLRGLDFALIPWHEGALTWLDRLNMARYASAALPVVCGDHPELVATLAQSHAGYVAEDETTWLLALRKLLDQPRLRQSLGERGRLWAKHERGLRAQMPRLASFLRQMAARGASGQVL